MTAEFRAILVMSLKLIDREETALGEHGVQTRSRVSLAQNEPVPARRLGILGVDMENSCVKRGENIR